MSETALRVESLSLAHQIAFSDATRSVFANLQTFLSPECMFFAHIVDLKKDSVAIVDFVRRLNCVIEILNGSEREVLGVSYCKLPNQALECNREKMLAKPKAFAALCLPIIVPLVGGQTLLTAYVFVQGLPCWSIWYDDDNKRHCTFDGEVARDIVNTLTSQYLLAVREGELPPGYNTPCNHFVFDHKVKVGVP